MRLGRMAGGLAMAAMSVSGGAGAQGTAAPAAATAGGAGPPALAKLAAALYEWRLEAYPVSATDQGWHGFDDRLTDYAEPALAARNQAMKAFRARFDALDPAAFAATADRVDWILFRAQLERDEFHDRVRDPEHRDPG